jgi:signal transduction histidine kinase
MGAVTTRARDLADDYAVAPDRFLAEPGEPALARAHEFGRRALGDGLGVLDMATAHSQALAAALSRARADEERARVLEAFEQCFAEALAPFEMAHRAFWEGNLVLRRLNVVLESQISRIASTLHDDVGQLLAAAHLALAGIANDYPRAAGDARAAREMLDQIDERLRTLAHELRPPILKQLGLVPALEFLGGSLSKRWGFRVTVQAAIDRPLPATVETTLYRVAQEALANAGRHARATQANVDVRCAAQSVVCSIRDDGVGVGAAPMRGEATRGIGLMEIEERVAALGGVLRLGRNEDCGTVLTVEIPLEH